MSENVISPRSTILIIYVHKHPCHVTLCIHVNIFLFCHVYDQSAGEAVRFTFDKVLSKMHVDAMFTLMQT